MAPTSTLIEIIDELDTADREKVEEYILLLRSKEELLQEQNTDFDKSYREYVLKGIADGEAAVMRGEYYTVQEARERLLSPTKE